MCKLVDINDPVTVTVFGLLDTVLFWVLWTVLHLAIPVVFPVASYPASVVYIAVIYYIVVRRFRHA